MILLPVTRALYADVEPVHLRASFDVLFARARDQLGLDVLRSAIVLFFNRDRCRATLCIPPVSCEPAEGTCRVAASQVGAAVAR